MLDSSWTKSRTWTLDCKPPWPASTLTLEFEASVLILKPLQHISPVAKKYAASTKQPNSLMSNVEGSTAIAATNAKPSIGKMGVHLQWHTKEEYNKITQAQKKELYEWRVANPDAAKLPEKMKTKGKGKYHTKNQISSLVTRYYKLELNKETEEKKEQDEYVAYIMSLMQNAVTTASLAVANASSVSMSTPACPAHPAGSALKSILCHV